MTYPLPADASAADAALFGETLSCEVELPLAVIASDARGRQAQAVALLAGLAQIEDLRKDDGGEERGELPLLAQRMDAKLDLILALLGRLARAAEELPERQVHWSRLGMRIDLDANADAALVPGDAAVLRVQPADWLPDHLELPATVTARAERPHGARLWLRFTDLRSDLSEALDRHLFRLHRRQIAEQRRR